MPPANAAETMLVEEIAQCFWRLQRARAIEAENFNLACCGPTPSSVSTPATFSSTACGDT